MKNALYTHEQNILKEPIHRHTAASYYSLCIYVYIYIYTCIYYIWFLTVS